MTPDIHSRKLFNDNPEWVSLHLFELKGMSHMLLNKTSRQNNFKDVKDISRIQNCSEKYAIFIQIQRKLVQQFIQHLSIYSNGELFRIAAMAHGKSNEKQQFNASKVFR